MPVADATSVVSSLSLHFRRRRMLRFAREFNINSNTRVLDIGGAPDYWRLLAETPRLVILNMPRAIEDDGCSYPIVAGDGCRLPFRDGTFDIVFSNSVIEHVGSASRQQEFAREAARVGRAYWIQTPNRWFPVEQHLLTPVIHWLSPKWKRALVPRLNIWSRVVPATPDRKRFYIEHFLSEIRLLGPTEMRRLFPGARLVRERFCGITKSLIALGR